MESARLHQMAQILVASWALGADERKRIPTSHGLLDRALHAAIQKDAFPKWVHEGLHFADSRVGLQCVELPLILEWAQRAALTSTPNPSYQTAELKIGSDAARHLLRRLNIAETDAASWGRLLQETIREARDQEHAAEFAQQAV